MTRYSVGVQEMDAQHQKLVVLINRFYDSIKDGGATSEVEAVLNELLIYVDVHFSSEEDYMKTINFPDLEAHKVNHSSFRVG